MADKVENSKFVQSTTVAFTLPIACSVCLGKVKQPVVCPNSHVFCRSCIDVWLERNSHCPACRVEITKENPCRPVLGGLTHTEETGDFSTAELRRTRVDLLFKEYEDEISRLTSKLLKYKKDNRELRAQNSGDGDRQRPDPDGTPCKDAESFEVLSEVKKKLRHSTSAYDKLKKEMAKYKQENNQLKDANIDLTRENQKLRVEIVNRSPQRYGRYTLAALETKVEKYEKEIKKLERALEKSDSYIEDLHKEIENLKSGKTPDNSLRRSPRKYKSPEQSTPPSGVKRKLNMDDATVIKPGDSVQQSPKKSLFNLSFDLEQPSPSTPCEHLRGLSINNSASPLHQQRVCRSNYLRELGIVDADLDNTTLAANKELDDLNITVTPELSDCMKLFRKAEQKVTTQEHQDAGPSSVKSKNIVTEVPEINQYHGDGYSSRLESKHTGNLSQSSCLPQHSRSSRSTAAGLEIHKGNGCGQTSIPQKDVKIPSLTTLAGNPEVTRSNNHKGFCPVGSASVSYSQAAVQSQLNTKTLGTSQTSLCNQEGKAISNSDVRNQFNPSTESFKQCWNFLDEAKKKIQAREKSMQFIEKVLIADDDLNFGKDSDIPPAQPYGGVHHFYQSGRNENAGGAFSQYTRPVSAIDNHFIQECSSRPSSAPGAVSGAMSKVISSSNDLFISNRPVNTYNSGSMSNISNVTSRCFGRINSTAQSSGESLHQTPGGFSVATISQSTDINPIRALDFQQRSNAIAPNLALVDNSKPPTSFYGFNYQIMNGSNRTSNNHK